MAGSSDCRSHAVSSRNSAASRRRSSVQGVSPGSSDAFINCASVAVSEAHSRSEKAFLAGRDCLRPPSPVFGSVSGLGLDLLLVLPLASGRVAGIWITPSSIDRHRAKSSVILLLYRASINLTLDFLRHRYNSRTAARRVTVPLARQSAERFHDQFERTAARLRIVNRRGNDDLIHAGALDKALHLFANAGRAADGPG